MMEQDAPPETTRGNVPVEKRPTTGSLRTRSDSARCENSRWPEWIVAVAAIVGIPLALWSLSAVQQELRLSRESLELGNRAWVLLGNPEPRGRWDGRLVVDIPIVNFGQGPAFNVRVDDKFGADGKDPLPERCLSEAITADDPQNPNETIGPGQSGARRIVFLLEKGQGRWVSGVISYDDQFGSRRTTHFCHTVTHRLDGSFELEPCARCNKAG